MPDFLPCWRCGADLSGLPSPFGRLDECPDCGVDLHVCRFCTFYDTSVAKHCRETIAEEVKDKERSTFCDYFIVHPGAFSVASDTGQTASKAALEAMFSLDAGSSGTADGAKVSALVDDRRAKEQQARTQLDDLFGLSEKKDPET